MQNIMQRTLLLVVCSLFIGSSFAQSVVDEVVWVVGDEAILKSDIEQMRLQAAQTGMRFKGNPDCAIPEHIAVQDSLVADHPYHFVNYTMRKRRANEQGTNYQQ